MSENITSTTGVFVLIDLVDSTPQAKKLKTSQLSDVYEYFYSEIQKRVSLYDFEIIKKMGDAVIIFGTSPENFVKIVSELLSDNLIEDIKFSETFTFKINIRIVADYGLFHFIVDKHDKKNDYADSKATAIHRLEKYANSGHFIFTEYLNDYISKHIDEAKFNKDTLRIEKRLKGFEYTGKYDFLYRISARRKITRKLSEKFGKRLDYIKLKSKEIPVFGGIYGFISMENDFLNMSLEYDFTGYANDNNSEKYNATDLLGKFNKGIIVGLPGAGKTTILNKIIYQVSKEDQDSIIIFVYCSQFTEESFNEQFDDIYKILGVLLKIFLFQKGNLNLNEVELEEYENAYELIKEAWDNNKLIILVDALDESQTIYIKNYILDFVRTISGFISDDSANSESNKIFLSSRINDISFTLNTNCPILKVNSLKSDDIGKIARFFKEYREDKYLYNKFERDLQKIPIMEIMCSTPLMAMLVIIYYERFRSFELRFTMYDIIIKFILNLVWQKIRENHTIIPAVNFSSIFEDAKKELNKQAKLYKPYKVLSELSYNLLFDTTSNTPEMEFPETLLNAFFAEISRKSGHTKIFSKGNWLEICKTEHVFVSSGIKDGNRHYVFLHATLMEFLAAWYFIKIYECKTLFLEPLFNINADNLETLPIACGYNYETAAIILSYMERYYKDRVDSAMPFRCLSEIEALEKKILTTHSQSRRFIEKETSKINLLKPKREWVYIWLANILMRENESKAKTIEFLSLNKARFKSYIPLCQNNFLKYIKDWDSSSIDTDIVKARRAFLEVILTPDVFEEAIDRKLDKIENLDNYKIHVSKNEYDKYDTNFNFYKNDIKIKYLTGLFGSPNLKHNGVITCISLINNYKHIISGSFDSTLILWDIETGRSIRTFMGHKKKVLACSITTDDKYLISASSDFTLKLWDINTGENIRSFIGHNNDVNTCAVTPDNKRILSGSSDCTLKLWDIETGLEIKTLTGHKVSIKSCVISKDGKKIISGSSDGIIKFWDIETGAELISFVGHKSAINTCRLTSDDKILISCSSDNTLKTWDMRNGKAIRDFVGHSSSVITCCVTLDCKKIFSVSVDRKIKQWNIETGIDENTFIGHTDDINACAVTADNTKIVTASKDNTIRIWDIETKTDLKPFYGHIDWVICCTFTDDGKKILSGSADNTLKLWDTETGKNTKTFRDHTSWVTGCIIMPDDNRIISSSSDKTLKVWDIEKESVIRTFAGHERNLGGCTLTPDKKKVFSYSEDTVLKLWNIETGNVVKTFEGHTDWVTCCKITRDGKFMISASRDGTLRLWNMEVGNVLKIFERHEMNITSCVLTHNENMIVSSSDDATIIIWDIETCERVRTIRGHDKAVGTCVLTADNRYILSGSEDYTIRIWDFESGKEMEKIELLWVPRAIAISPTNPSQIITANGNGTLTEFNIPIVI